MKIVARTKASLKSRWVHSNVAWWNQPLRSTLICVPLKWYLSGILAIRPKSMFPTSSLG